MYACFVTLTKLYSGDKIKENEMGEACGMYGEDIRTGFWWYSLRKRQHLKYPSVNGRKISKLFL